ncbi:MAG: amidohydrolase [Bacteroidetes bacterium]|nr:amidohydrolase [Bacteroidota bacterium]
MRNSKFVLFTCLITMLCSCAGTKKEQVDLVVHNGVVYTVDSVNTIVQSFAVKEGKIIALGTNDEVIGKYEAKEKVDACGKAIYPGFYDAHCHFNGYGMSLKMVDLVGTKSFAEVVQRTVDFQKKNNGLWITGRGWDQNDWGVKEFPTKDTLDKLFPNTPLILRRVDGHGALANQAAFDKAGVTVDSKISGGIVEVKNGKLTGILIDNAIDLVEKAIPEPAVKQNFEAILAAQNNCFAVGLTTVDDAGLSKNIVMLIDSMHKSGDLKMRIYAMLTSNDENLDYYLQHGPYKTERLNVSSFKFYADGALGSRGACLLQPYSDRPGQNGFLLKDISYYKEQAQKLFDKGFQMNTHCIGDSANRFILNVYGAVLKGKNDKRWRIEHAQVINKEDFHLFKEYSIVPSVQATHCTSDMDWADERLGSERIKGAYAYKELLKQNGYIAGGSDFPVEDINPLFGFYSAITRMHQDGTPKEGFQVENGLSREEALRSMTIWAARSNFEEYERGSLEPGKMADFVILEEDIMKIDSSKIYNVKVAGTYINGDMVYRGK